MTVKISSCADRMNLVQFGTGAPAGVASFNGRCLYTNVSTGEMFFLDIPTGTIRKGGGATVVVPPTPSTLIDLIISDAKSFAQTTAKGGNENAIQKNVVQTGSNSILSQSAPDFGPDPAYGATEYFCPNYPNPGPGAGFRSTRIYGSNKPKWTNPAPNIVPFLEVIPTATTPDSYGGQSETIETTHTKVLALKNGVWSLIFDGLLAQGSLFNRSPNDGSFIDPLPSQYATQSRPGVTFEMKLVDGVRNWHTFANSAPAGGTGGYSCVIVYNWQRVKPGTKLAGVEYQSHVGMDWYIGGGSVCDYGAGAGQGRPKLLTTDWQLQSWVAVLGVEPGGASGNHAGGITESQFRLNPPPIDAAPAF